MFNMQYYASSSFSFYPPSYSFCYHLPHSVVINGFSYGSTPGFPGLSWLWFASFVLLVPAAHTGSQNLQLQGLGRVALGPVYGRSGHSYGTSGAFGPMLELSVILQAGRSVPIGGAKTDYAILLLLTLCALCYWYMSFYLAALN